MSDQGGPDMKLSEAIRLGSMLHPQGRFSVKGPDGKTCALGAAAEAVGVSGSTLCDVVPALRDLFPNIWDTVASPIDKHRDVLWNVIVDLNDTNCWTREQIADWAQSIEDAQPSTTGDQSEALKSVDAVREEVDAPIVAPRD